MSILQGSQNMTDSKTADHPIASQPDTGQPGPEPRIIVSSESADWFLIPVSRKEEWQKSAMYGEPPEWARYIRAPDEVLIHEFDFC